MRSLLSLNESTPTQRQYLYPLKNSHNPLQVCTFSTSTEQTKETAGIYPTHNTHIDPTPAQNHQLGPSVSTFCFENIQQYNSWTRSKEKSEELRGEVSVQVTLCIRCLNRKINIWPVFYIQKLILHTLLWYSIGEG